MHTYILKEPSQTPTSQTKRYGVVKLTQDVHAHFFMSCLQEEGQQPKAPRKLDPKGHLQWVAKLVLKQAYWGSGVGTLRNVFKRWV